jgi:hypothetical protein
MIQAVRSSAVAVLVAALCLAGCARRVERMLTSAERQECQGAAARVSSPGSSTYNSIFKRCVYSTLHPERGGG